MSTTYDPDNVKPFLPKVGQVWRGELLLRVDNVERVGTGVGKYNWWITYTYQVDRLPGVHQGSCWDVTFLSCATLVWDPEERPTLTKICIKCKTAYPDAEARAKFMCWGCNNGWS